MGVYFRAAPPCHGCRRDAASHEQRPQDGVAVGARVERGSIELFALNLERNYQFFERPAVRGKTIRFNLTLISQLLISLVHQLCRNGKKTQFFLNGSVLTHHAANLSVIILRLGGPSPSSVTRQFHSLGALRESAVAGRTLRGGAAVVGGTVTKTPQT